MTLRLFAIAMLVAAAAWACMALVIADRAYTAGVDDGALRGTR